jgi:hypothetical protein
MTALVGTENRRDGMSVASPGGGLRDFVAGRR